MKSLAYLFRVSPPSITKIIPIVCNAIWDVLYPHVLSKPTTQKWRKIAHEINEKWQFPNCVGALDGKHIVMQAPPRSGSTFYNYKGSHSLVLLAACDSNCRFTVVDIGGSGRNSDGGLFRESLFGRAIENKQLGLPSPSVVQCIPRPLPFCFVGDEAFPLKENLMRPYPGRNLSRSKTVFNYRLSRVRRLIENSFGIMSSRFRIFRRPIIANVSTVESIIKGAICLHNFLKLCDDYSATRPKTYCPPGYMDYEDDNGNLHDGSWRLENEQGALRPIGRIGPTTHSMMSAHVRSTLEVFFNGFGSLPGH